VKGNVLTLGLSSFSVAAPRLHEYVVQAARTLPSLLSNGDIDLDGTYAANKLAVCLGDGASYDKHLDNSGQGCVSKIKYILADATSMAPTCGNTVSNSFLWLLFGIHRLKRRF
jgi:hypothetical protein